MQPCKTLLIDTPYIKKMYKEIRKKKKEKKRETFQDVKLAQTRRQNLSMSKIDRL
jgi:hypothetical protein